VNSWLALPLLGAALALGACSGAEEPAATATTRASTSTAQLTTTVPAATASTASTGGTPKAAATSVATSTAAPAATASAVRKVNANTATRAEIQAALEAAGVPNASNWSREVVEYRPYAADDANWTKLRTELAKYNPAPGVVDQIISALEK